EALRFLEHPALRLTVSLGVSVAGGWCRDLSVLLAEADAALFQAKAGGRNQVVLAECPVHR
ncbi:MAG TPA: hypothetical protein VLH39_08595, partial [Magnetospirillaceae bacterium]|nr:hypothetical protein [Magnetospirillaceae bacterium]